MIDCSFYACRAGEQVFQACFERTVEEGVWVFHCLVDASLFILLLIQLTTDSKSGGGRVYWSPSVVREIQGN